MRVFIVGGTGFIGYHTVRECLRRGHTVPLFYPKGGTNMIAVEHVAEAIAGAIERGVGGERYPVGDENLTWVVWLERLTALLGKRKRVITLPTALVRFVARFLALSHRWQGRESGLDPVKFVDVQTRNTFFDPTPSRVRIRWSRRSVG